MVMPVSKSDADCRDDADAANDDGGKGNSNKKKMIATVTYDCQNDHHGEESEDQDYDNRAMDRFQELAHRAKPAR